MTDQIRGLARGEADVPLSILDLATVSEGGTATDALRTSTELVRHAERWGYHRYWVAEHHGMPSVASSSPAVLIAHLAANSESIRLGSGGVMLPNHPPLIVAEQFATLHALHPGRIDLGLGRAPGTDPATASAMRRGDADAFPEEVAALAAFLDGEAPGGLQSYPLNADRPPIWLLGSSGFSAQLAGLLGLPFAFAHHFSAENTEPALDLYRSTFRPSRWLDRPYAMIGVSAVAADSSEQALRLSRTLALAMLRLRRGRPSPIPSPEEAEAYPYSDVELTFVDGYLRNVVKGTGAEVRAGLGALRERTQADELMITTGVYGGANRIRSYELIAEAHKLKAPGDA
ncbi:LLM class flavin-dependent oxidoreductase [Nonomuraea dietziae]|uniref:LLM class flavin-dependent oxidoreductase n=1 Tax=Nonomuraea dietziae TaxID=65515 RepID=UPI0033CCC4E1